MTSQRGETFPPSRSATSDVNSGKHWSEMDMQDLRDGLRLRSPMQELADFLIRDIEEVRAKAAELQVEQE